MDGRYLSGRHSGDKRFNRPNHIYIEDTFNFTITFNVPAGAPTGLHTFHIDYYRDAVIVDSQLVNLWVFDCVMGYDDPIAIREDLKREKVIFRGNTILVAEGYKVEIYSPDGRKIKVLNGGRYEFRKGGIYFIKTQDGRVIRVFIR